MNHDEISNKADNVERMATSVEDSATRLQDEAYSKDQSKVSHKPEAHGQPSEGVNALPQLEISQPSVSKNIAVNSAGTDRAVQSTGSSRSGDAQAQAHGNSLPSVVESSGWSQPESLKRDVQGITSFEVDGIKRESATRRNHDKPGRAEEQRKDEDELSPDNLERIRQDRVRAALEMIQQAETRNVTQQEYEALNPQERAEIKRLSVGNTPGEGFTRLPDTSAMTQEQIDSLPRDIRAAIKRLSVNNPPGQPFRGVPESSLRRGSTR